MDIPLPLENNNPPTLLLCSSIITIKSVLSNRVVEHSLTLRLEKREERNVVRSNFLKGIETTCRDFVKDFSELYSVNGLLIRLYMWKKKKLATTRYG